MNSSKQNIREGCHHVSWREWSKVLREETRQGRHQRSTSETHNHSTLEEINGCNEIVREVSTQKWKKRTDEHGGQPAWEGVLPREDSCSWGHLITDLTRNLERIRDQRSLFRIVNSPANSGQSRSMDTSWADVSMLHMPEEWLDPPLQCPLRTFLPRVFSLWLNYFLQSDRD